MSALSDRLGELAGEVEDLEGELRTARDEIRDLNERLDTAQGRVAELELEVIEAEADDEVYELIGDVKRGVLSIEELFDRTVGRP